MRNLDCSTMSDFAAVLPNTPPAETEGGRRPTEVSAGGVDKLPYDAFSVTTAPNPEIVIKKPRRAFTAAYKMQILNELDACKNIGEKGAILRREGLYSSRITTWRKQRRNGALHALDNKRGRKALYSPNDMRIADLEKQNAQLQKQLIQAEMVIDIQKKISETFGITAGNNHCGENK